jgi:hypothetical protein
MAMNCLTKVFFCIALVVVFVSCKKEDKEKPIVKINYPFGGAEFYQGDTMVIRVEVKDNVSVKKIRFSLLDENNVSVVPASAQELDAKEASVLDELILEGAKVQTGEYILQVVASDGVNEGREFCRIKITASPRRVKGLFVFTMPSAQTVKLYKTDSLFQNPSLISTFNGDFAAAVYNSNTQQLVKAGYSTGNLVGIDTKTFIEKWSNNPLFSNGIPSYTDVNFFESNVYVSSYDGYVRLYNEGGVVVSSFSTYSGYYPRKVLRHNHLFLAEEKTFSGNNRHIAVYYAESGAARQETPLNMDVIDIFYKDADRFLFFGNENNQAKMIMYEDGSNGTWEPKVLPVGSLKKAVKYNSNIFFIAHQNAVYKYEYSINSLTTFINVANAMDLVYDSIGDVLFVVSGNQVRIYNAQNGGLMGSFNAPETIIKTLVWYNK